MKHYPKLKKWLKGIAISILIVVVILFSIPFILKEKIEKYLQEQIQFASKGIYILKMNDFNFNLLTNTIEANNFSLVADTSKIDNRSKVIVEINSEHITIDGFSYLKFLLKKSIEFDEINFKNGNVNINFHPNYSSNKSSNISRIVFHKIKFINGNFSFYNSKEKRMVYTGKGDLEIKKMFLNKGSMPTVLEFDTKLTTSKFNIKNKLFSIHSSQISLIDEILTISLFDFTLEEETRELLKLFPKSKVKFNFKTKELTISFSRIDQVEKIIKNDIKSLRINELKLIKPELTFYKDSIKSRDSIVKKPSIFPLFIKSLVIKNGIFQIVETKNNTKRLESFGINCNLSLIEPSPQYYAFPYRAENIKINIDSLNFYHKNGVQRSDFYAISLNTDDSTLSCKKWQFKATIPEKNYFDTMKFQTDYPNISVHGIKLNRVDAEYLLERKYLHVQSALVQNFSMNMTRNKNYPYKIGKVVKMPQEQIKGLEYPFYISEVVIKNGQINYFEIPKNGSEKGHLWLDRVQVKLFNFSNDSSVLSYDDTLQVEMEAYFYNQGLIQVYANMPMNDPTKKHYVYGKIGTFDPTNLNKILINAAKMKVQKGTINGGEFEFIADEKKSIGQLNLLFKKLKFKVMTEENGKMKSDNLKSMIANLFITRNNPVQPGQEPIIGAIEFNRDQSRWIINYWWKSLFSGINNIVMARRAELKALQRDFARLQQSRKNKLAN